MTRVLCVAMALVLAVLPAAPAQSTAPTFEKDILPILKERCFECHGIPQPKSGLDLQTRAGATKGGKTSPAVTPGSLKHSLMWTFLSTDKMPPSEKKVTDAEKELIRLWILAGAPADGVAATKTASSASRNGPAKKRGVEAVAKIVDTAILSQLARDKAKLAPPTDDAEFLRRAYLDLNARIPSVEQARAFLDSKDPKKRSNLVDELLASPQFAKQLGGLWARLITVEEPYLRGDLETWLTAELHKSTGWDQLVRTMITAEGKGPETAFVMSNVDNKMPKSDKLAGATAKVFLGMQLQCAECHNHPFTAWKQTDFWALAAFYSRTRMATKTAPIGLGETAAADLKGLKPGAEPSITIPSTAGRGAGKVVKAALLGNAPKWQDKDRLRVTLADWVVAPDNPYFAQAAVNRVWAQLFGMGQVNPVDDLQEDNPATHPEVLQVLAEEFQASGFDFKHLVRCICATATYQRSSRSTGGESDQVAYARMKLKVMSADALYDSLTAATGLKDIAIRTGVAATSGSGGAAKKAAGTAREKFVRFFSTAALDDLPIEFTHGIPQALNLMNDPVFNQGNPMVQQAAKLAPEQGIETLYLATLSRRPTAEELGMMRDYLKTQPDAVRACVDIQWVLLNSSEFMLIR